MKLRRVWALVSCVILVLAASMWAAPRGVNVGVKGGLSLPNIRGSEDDVFSKGFGSRQGLFFGLFAETRLSSRFSLVAELNYASQGGRRDGIQPITMDMSGLPVPPGTILFADFVNETILNYIELPVLGRLVLGDRLRFFVNAGPYVGLLIGHHAVTKGTSAMFLDEGETMPIIIPPATEPLIVDLGADTDVGDSLKNWNFGVAGGLGLLYPFGRGDVTIEARFEYGLTTIQRDVTTSGDTQTGAIAITLGYSLPLRRR